MRRLNLYLILIAALVILFCGCPAPGPIDSSLTGVEISDGTYELLGGTISYQFGGANCKRTISAGAASEIVYTGTWLRNSDSSLEFSLSYEVGGVSAGYKEKYNAGFVCAIAGDTYLILGAMEKTSGGTDTIVGTYSYWYEIMTNIGGVDSTQRSEISIEYKKDHTLSIAASVGGSTTSASGTWTEDQVSSGLLSLATFTMGSSNIVLFAKWEFSISPGTNMIVNGDFNNGMENWVLDLNNGGSASASIENGECFINISGIGDNGWNIQLLYEGGLELK